MQGCCHLPSSDTVNYCLDSSDTVNYCVLHIIWLLFLRFWPIIYIDGVGCLHEEADTVAGGKEGAGLSEEQVDSRFIGDTGQDTPST